MKFIPVLLKITHKTKNALTVWIVKAYASLWSTAYVTR